MCIYIYIFIYLHTYDCVEVCMITYICDYVCICMYMYVYIDTCMWTQNAQGRTRLSVGKKHQLTRELAINQQERVIIKDNLWKISGKSMDNWIFVEHLWKFIKKNRPHGIIFHISNGERTALSAKSYEFRLEMTNDKLREWHALPIRIEHVTKHCTCAVKTWSRMTQWVPGTSPSTACICPHSHTYNIIWYDVIWCDMMWYDITI